jgi:uncharacterized protein (TIGR04255 family)
MPQELDSPFGEAPILEIPLPEAPLVNVVAQMRFPKIATIGQQDFIAPFQEALRDLYPIMRAEQQFAVVLSPEGVTQQAQGLVWRLNEAEPGWSVVLCPDFLAIETPNYSSRDDFLGRWEYALQALDKLVHPVVFDRLGVRYLNRLTGSDSGQDLPQLIRPEVYGTLGIDVPSGEFIANFSNAHFRLDGPEMQARWGRLPAGAQIPGVEPLDEPSWFLDVDVYVQEQRQFSIESAMSVSRHAADHAYRFFRWAVTNEFLRRFGAAV